MKVSIKWEPRDCWVGVSWTRVRGTTLETDTETIYWVVCLLPCFPIIFSTERNLKPKAGKKGEK